MELAAIAAVTVAYPAPLQKMDKEVPDFPAHLRPSPSPPSSPTPSHSSEPCSSPKKQLVNPEDHYDCGTLAFMAGKLKPKVHNIKWRTEYLTAKYLSITECLGHQVYTL